MPYLDHNATTSLRPEVRALMISLLGETGNASSIHSHGRTARSHIEKARQQIADVLNVGPQQVIFNSGASEGNNTILKGFTGKRVLVSAIEHPSVINSNVPVETIPVDTNGIVQLNILDKLLKEKETALVSVMLVNNETGIIQPMTEIAALAKQHGALLHVDAVQALGRIPFTRESIGADFITLSSHKIGGPQGVGAIVFAAKAPLPKLLHGGGQERRQRAGTENVAGIAGFGLAAELAVQNLTEFQKLAVLRDKLEAGLESSGPIIHGKASPRVSNTTCFSTPEKTSDMLLMGLDLERIAVSSGSACSSGTVKTSHVLAAMGVSDDLCKSGMRISTGWDSTEKDIEIFLTAWNKITAKN